MMTKFREHNSGVMACGDWIDARKSGMTPSIPNFTDSLNLHLELQIEWFKVMKVTVIHLLVVVLFLNPELPGAYCRRFIRSSKKWNKKTTFPEQQFFYCTWKKSCCQWFEDHVEDTVAIFNHFSWIISNGFQIIEVQETAINVVCSEIVVQTFEFL